MFSSSGKGTQYLSAGFLRPFLPLFALTNSQIDDPLWTSLNRCKCLRRIFAPIPSLSDISKQLPSLSVLASMSSIFDTERRRQRARGGGSPLGLYLSLICSHDRGRYSEGRKERKRSSPLISSERRKFLGSQSKSCEAFNVSSCKWNADETDK